mgnify:CR=1 FL=1
MTHLTLAIVAMINLALEVPLKRADNRCMITMKKELYGSLVDELLSTDNGPSRWAWMRRRALQLYYKRYGSELEGSSDLSGYVYSLWCYRGEDSLDDNFGWWINGEICEIMDIPNTKATREYHNQERA